MSCALRKLHKSVSVLQYLLKLSALIQIPRGRESVVRYIPVKKYDSSPPLWPTLPPRVMISTNLNLLYHRKDASTLICFSFSGRSVFKKSILKDFSLLYIFLGKKKFDPPPPIMAPLYPRKS